MNVTVRKQYFFRPAAAGYDAWDVDTLIALTAALPRKRVPLAAICELDEAWFGEGEAATWRALIDHVKLMDDADLSFPVILAADGRVMDGMHRVAKALRLGHDHIDAVQFGVDPPPAHINVRPDDLPYD
jgi:hypothetical protein